jgi:hypothetical protein
LPITAALLCVQLSPELVAVLINALSEQGAFEQDGRAVRTGGATFLLSMQMPQEILNVVSACPACCSSLTCGREMGICRLIWRGGCDGLYVCRAASALGLYACAVGDSVGRDASFEPHLVRACRLLHPPACSMSCAALGLEGHSAECCTLPLRCPEAATSPTPLSRRRFT